DGEGTSVGRFGRWQRREGQAGLTQQRAYVAFGAFAVRVIALINAKGGPGKSTLSASLAVAAAEAGESVIALDLDPQRSLAMWGDKRKADTPAVDQVDAGELPDILATLANRFSVAIIDTAGTAGTATNLAVQGADLCLVP